MNLIDSHETSTINCTEDNRGQWRIERTKLEDYIAAAYTRTADALRRGELTEETTDQA
ncbi:hypothetical protein SAMN04488693_1418 [Arthrobacter subterraneus]|uniref:Uncharacterized protein n=1 Tax=Arthrobacter subterraneus TaxID=335973 RepID=A0A1G8Q1F7_9MICC|nr:hypothetical protein [Arthrobacter subterraneus]SDI98543.1 hypothetical protein SAMN04488693_1418 [Arthrobacter subterraneus]